MSRRWCEACSRPRPYTDAACPGCGGLPEGVAPAPTPWAAAPPAAPPTAPPGPPWASPYGGPPASPHPALWVPTPLPPSPRRRTSSPWAPLVGLVIILLAVGGTIAALVGFALDDFGRDVAATEDVDEPDERVAVSAPGTGIRWTMQREPEQQRQGVPGSGGSMTLWVVDRGEVAEGVGILPLGDAMVVGGDTDLLDRGLEGSATSLGGSVSDVTDTRLAGRPARTGRIDGEFKGREVVGRITIALVDDNLVFTMFVGEADEDEAVGEQEPILRASVRAG